jgi:hypothetical protein
VSAKGDHFPCTGALAGDVTEVLAVMRCQWDSAVVQQQGCAALLRLSSSGDAAKSAICVAGGVAVVIAAMHRHSDSVDVQEHGCGALCGLVDASASGGGEGCVGLEVVIAAMARHASSAAVQRRGIDALRALARDAASRTAIVSAGGVALVVSAMRRHGHVSSQLWRVWNDDRHAYEETGDSALERIVGSRTVSVSLLLYCILLQLRSNLNTGSAVMMCSCYAYVQLFTGFRRHWLAACDVVGRDAAAVVEPELSGAKRLAMTWPAPAWEQWEFPVPSSPVAQVVGVALADRVRVSVVGDLSTRPRVCASEYGHIVATFLPC